MTLESSHNPEETQQKPEGPKAVPASQNQVADYQRAAAELSAKVKLRVESPGIKMKTDAALAKDAVETVKNFVKETVLDNKVGDVLTTGLELSKPDLLTNKNMVGAIDNYAGLGLENSQTGIDLHMGLAQGCKLAADKSKSDMLALAVSAPLDDSLQVGGYALAQQDVVLSGTRPDAYSAGISVSGTFF